MQDLLYRRPLKPQLPSHAMYSRFGSMVIVLRLKPACKRHHLPGQLPQQYLPTPVLQAVVTLLTCGKTPTKLEMKCALVALASST